MKSSQIKHIFPTQRTQMISILRSIKRKQREIKVKQKNTYCFMELI
jgi:hypothetical protein